MGSCPNMQEAWRKVSTISRFVFVELLNGLCILVCSLFAVIVYSRSVDLWSMGVWVKCIWSMDVLCTVCECFLTHLQFIDGAVGHSMAPWPLFWGLSAVMCIPGQWICSLWVSGWSLFGQWRSYAQSVSVSEPTSNLLVVLWTVLWPLTEKPLNIQVLSSRFSIIMQSNVNHTLSCFCPPSDTWRITSGSL